MKSANAVSCLSALAHEGRLTVFRELVQAAPEGLAVGELASCCQLNIGTVSAQLSVLSQSGLISGHRQGRSITYRVNFSAVDDLLGFLMKDCCGGRKLEEMI